MWLATRVSVRPLPWFHHSCIAWITSCLLCSSACSVGSCCSGGHTCHTLTVPCQDLLARPQQVQFGIRRAPSAPSSSCPWQRGLWGALRAALPSCTQGEPSAAALLPLIRGKGSSPWTQGASAPGPDPIPVWGTATGPPALGAQHWHTGLELTATGKARTATAQKWGSTEFIAQSTL